MSNEKNQGLLSLLNGVQGNLVVLVGASLVTVLLAPLMPGPSLGALHLNAVRAVREVAPDMKCTESPGPGPVDSSRGPKLEPEAVQPFFAVVTELNTLAEHLRSSDGSAAYYHCSLPELQDQHSELMLTRPELITHSAAVAVKNIDTILSIYHRDPDLPRTASRSLQTVRDNILRIAYAAGDLDGLPVFAAVVDIIVVVGSFLYMIATFMALQGAIPSKSREVITSAIAVIVVLLTIGTAKSDWFVSPYALLALMIISVAYTWQPQASPSNHNGYGRLRSLLFLFRSGAILYGVLLAALSALYLQGSYSVGSYPLNTLARLNVANAIFVVALTAFSIEGFRSRSYWAWVAFSFGPLAFLAALANYMGFFGSPGYPGNMLYRILSVGEGGYLSPIVPPFIEIVLARLMISIPIAFIVLRRLHMRIIHSERIQKFLSEGESTHPAVLEIEVGLGWVVYVEDDGIKIPSPPLSPGLSTHISEASLSGEHTPKFKRDRALETSATESITPNLSRKSYFFPTSNRSIASHEHDAMASPSSDILAWNSKLLAKTLGNVWFQLRLLVSASRPANVVMAVVLAEVSYILSAANEPDLKLQIVLAASTSLAVAGSFIINDYADVYIDRINKPYRAIASGLISLDFARNVGFSAFFCSILISFIGSLELGLFSTSACLLSLAYTFVLKRQFGLLANVLSATLTTGICFAGCFVTGRYADMFGISVAVFLACMAREIAKDVEDYPADRDHRAGTLIMLIGSVRAVRIASTLAVLQIVGSYLPYLLGTFDLTYLVGVTLVNTALGLGLLMLRHLDRSQSRILHERVKWSMAGYLIVYLVGFISRGF